MTARLPLPPGLVVAAPSSGAGKTTLALGLMRSLARAGLAVQPFKNGPDYIDPAFHARAAGRASFNLDSWAMPEALLAGLLAAADDADVALVEGSMGLFDGAPAAGRAGIGATADLAALTGWPILLLLDVTGQAQSAAATALGSARLRDDVDVAGVVLNRVASERHHDLARAAIEAAGLTVLGAIRREAAPALPERHLGLVQAGETAELEAVLDRLADTVEAGCDVAAIRAAARAGRRSGATRPALPPPAPRLALAADPPFSFAYPPLLDGWRAAGAELLPFSPLADEPPPEAAELAWLPGGYPELHAGRIAAAGRFRDGLVRFAATRPVHGECGGYMVLGEALTDAGGTVHRMAGLLGLHSDFARRRLHLGYRRGRLLADAAIGRAGDGLTGHEFHYASVAAAGDDPPLLAGAPVIT